ncbi:MAG TPA: terminase TerL endonuclease subunit [Vicinamibacterales bacterium]|nr:terminase TerL endonuclease subunit [Vicinamibacterales bacterium]
MTGPPAAGWWGDGPPPHERWPGTTIPLPAVWVSERARWESPDGRYYFDQAEAERACEFFPALLSHHIGEFAGKPFELLPYQRQLLTLPIFGWKRTVDGLRRFRKVFAFLPKGSGKSPWGSGTGLYLTLCDGEPAAEVYAVAGDKNQARIVHENAKIMVEQSPILREMCQVLRDSIYHPASRSIYQVLSAEAATKHGFRPHAVIFDEFHNQPDRDLYEALKKSLIKRRQPLMVLLTHAGTDDESICYEEYEYAKAVLEGRLDDETCLPVIFELRPEEDWTSPTTWQRVNPGYGVTAKPDALAQEAREAAAEPRKRNDFLRFHLNAWVNQATAWIPLDWWDRITDPVPPPEVLATAPAGAIGIDMAQKIDLAAVVAIFRLPLAEAPLEVEVVAGEAPEGELRRTLTLNYRLAVVPMFWLPEETLLERVQQDHIRYDIYRDQGLLRVTEGAVIDSGAIVRYIRELVTRYPRLKQGERIGYDPAFATEIGVQLQAMGLKPVEVPQNYAHLSEACQVFEALVKAGRVLHGGHRLLRWCLENTEIKRDDAGRIRPVKPKKSTRRIDGIVALLIALSRLIKDAGPPDSVYRSRGAYVVR